MKRLIIIMFILLMCAGGVWGAYSWTNDTIVLSELTVADPTANAGAELLTDPTNASGWSSSQDTDWTFNWCSWGSVVLTKDTSRTVDGSFAQGYRTQESGCASATMYSTTPASTTAGMWYRASIWAKRTATYDDRAYFGAYAGGGTGNVSSAITSSDWTKYIVTFRASDTNGRVSIGRDGPTDQGAGTDMVSVDEQSIQNVPLASMISVGNGGSQYGKAMVDLTIADGTQAGAMMCVDRSNNPQNYVWAWIETKTSSYSMAGNKVLHFEKVLNGVATGIGGGTPTGKYVNDDYPLTQYTPGGKLTLERKSGTNVFRLFYNGYLVDEATVADAEIISNTLHGVFNTYEGNTTANFKYSPATVGKTVVFFGGSISGGASATDGARLSGRALYHAYLTETYPGILITSVNSAIGGTDSTYGNSRLATDVIAYSPDIVFVDHAVNDIVGTTGMQNWPYVGEAVIRKLSLQLPNAKICVLDFVPPDSERAYAPGENTYEVKFAWHEIANLYNVQLIRLDTALQAIIGGSFPLDDVATSAYYADTVHPNSLGHGVIFDTLVSEFDPTVAPTSYKYSPARIGTNIYEGTPIIVNGTGMTKTGTWTGTTSIESTVDGATASYTGFFNAVILDSLFGSGQGLISYRIDEGAWTQLNLGSLSQTYQCVASTTNGTHTFTVRKDGTTKATINRFLFLTLEEAEHNYMAYPWDVQTKYSKDLYNITVGGMLYGNHDIVLTNSIAEAVNIASGVTITGDHNVFTAAAKSGNGTWINNGGNLWDTDPNFVSAGTDFRLQADSPCIDAGTPIWAESDYQGDLYGNPISGTAPDIGAIEYQQSETTRSGDENDGGNSGNRSGCFITTIVSDHPRE